MSKQEARRSKRQQVQQERALSRTVSRRQLDCLVCALLEWFSHSARDLPWRHTKDPYAIWVSEIMLQQTQVATVILYYERWLKALPNLKTLARASSTRLHMLWEGLGYYNRVRNMQTAAKLICREHAGRFPERYDEILALPGIGRYTAGAICSIAFNQPTPILDGNVIRVLTRVFGITSDPKEAKTNARLWQLAEMLVAHAARTEQQPAFRKRPSLLESCSAINQSLMELGARICVPRNPQCAGCPIRRHCSARRQDVVTQIPRRTVRPKVTARTLTLAVIQDGNRFWAVRRSQGNLNGGLWEFPRVDEVRLESTRSRRQKGLSSEDILLGTFSQSITRYRITAQVFLHQLGAQTPTLKRPGRWLTTRSLRCTPFSAMHRRIVDLILDQSSQ